MLLRDLDTDNLPGPLASISNEHRFTVRVLSLLEQEIQVLSQGLLADVRLLKEAMHFFHEVLDQVHHPREELIFARMQARAGEPVREVIAGLQRGHQELDLRAAELLAVCHRRRLFRARQRRRLAIKLSRYCRGLRIHMRIEETQIYAPAMELLSREDWDAVDEQLAALPNAICGINESSEYNWLLHRYLNQVVQVSAAGVPYALLDRAASLLERSLHASLTLARVPLRLSQGLRGPWRSVAPDLSGDSEADAVAAADAGTQVLTSEDQLMTYGERAGVYRRGWAMSWQAAAMSISLRAGIKPLMGAFPFQLSTWMRRHPSVSLRVPRGCTMVPAEGAAFAGRWISPKHQSISQRVILYLPGGAFVFPASNGHSRTLASLAAGCQARGLMVDYRLVPEHGFPAQIEDCLAAYQSLLAQGIAPHDIALAGDSAGGGLVLSLLQAIRDQQLPMPACAACFSPFADMSFSAPSHRHNRWTDSVLPSPFPEQTMSRYAGDTPLNHPLISPVNGDFRGCPSVLIQASSSEILLGDSLRVARKARAQGVDVELQIWQALPHAWQVFPQLPESRAALKKVTAFFNQQFDKAASWSDRQQPAA